MYIPPNPKLCLMKSSMKKSGFGFQTLEIKKNSQKLHFGVTKKNPGLPFHFHVLNWFKSWSNLGFDQDSNGHNKFKKKQTHSLLMSLVSTQVDKQGLDIFKLEKSCIYPLTLNSVL